jgi:hypothetical protein
MYIGAWLPFREFTIPELGITPLRLFGLAVGILALRRIPAILMLYKFIPEIESWKEALFCGHFGPVSLVFGDRVSTHGLTSPGRWELAPCSSLHWPRTSCRTLDPLPKRSKITSQRHWSLSSHSSFSRPSSFVRTSALIRRCRPF